MSAAHLQDAAMLTNPILWIEKMMLFDASFYQAPGQSILVALKYFNIPLVTVRVIIPGQF